MATRDEVEASILYALDEPGSNWAGTTELHNMVEAAYRAAWDIIIDRFQDYAVASSDFTIAGGASSFTLLVDSAPAAGQVLRSSFYKLRMLMRKGTVDGLYRAMDRFELEESGDFDRGMGYMFLGDALYIEPTGDAPGDYRAWYISQPASLSAGSTALLDPCNGTVRQYVIDVVCRRLRAKDSLSGKDFQDLADQMAERLAKMAGHRDARPRSIPDVRDRLPQRYRTRRNWM